ncbi:sulfatase-like hydrolase/transferase [Planctomycetota bacterium]
MKSLKFLKIALAVLVVGAAIFLLREFSWPSGKGIRSVILISIDTCRADYLGCYGYPSKITPNIDKFADQTILFSNAISPIPMTLPAHCSMLTGTIPPYHGVHDNFDYHLDESNLTLAEMLKADGFTTGAIISASVLDSRFGLDQGFDTYNDKFEEAHKALDINERKAGEATRVALQWLEQNKDEKFFLFLHYFDPHFPYEPPEPFASQFADNLYAGEIAYTDACIGQVIERLKKLGLYDSSLIIITGDHGEMLGEHGEAAHMYFIYQSAVKVPLILKMPNLDKPQRIENPVGLIDIVPTICSVLGISVGSDVQGENLLGKIGQGRDRYIYCESLYATKYEANSLLGVVTDKFKYIQTTRPELYDLTADPGEMNNLAAKQPHRARILKDRLKLILEQSVRKGETDTRMELDEQAIKRLESLGYVGGGVIEDFDFDQSRDDPKDLIDFHKRHSIARQLILKKQYKEAGKLYRELLLERPDIYTIILDVARIAMEQGNYKEAVVYLEKAIQLKPDKTQPHDKLGLALLGLGKTNEAVKHFEEVLRLSPETPGAHNTLGLALIRQRKYDLAITHFNKELEINSEAAEPHKNIGTAFFMQGRFDKSLEHFKKSLMVNPNQPYALLRTGQAYHRLGNTEIALEYYRKALQLESNGPPPMVELAWIFATSKDAAFRKPQEAVRLAQQACELTNYTNPVYLDTLAVAYAAAGRFSEAVQTAEKALTLARSAEMQARIVAEIQKRLELFKNNRPYFH